MGYRNLRVLDEGIPGWIRLGYPTEGTRAEALPIPHYPPGLEPPDADTRAVPRVASPAGVRP